MLIPGHFREASGSAFECLFQTQDQRAERQHFGRSTLVLAPQRPGYKVSRSSDLEISAQHDPAGAVAEGRELIGRQVQPRMHRQRSWVPDDRLAQSVGSYSEERCDC
jgi:hypothetical protein